MRTVLRALGLVLCLVLAPPLARAADEAGSEKRMRSEDRWVLAAAIVGSLASVGFGAFVHWKLLRGPGKPKDEG